MNIQVQMKMLHVSAMMLALTTRIAVMITHFYAAVVMEDVMPDMIHHFLASVTASVTNITIAAKILQMFVEVR